VPCIEAFNGRLRQECLNQHWFLLSLIDARDKIETGASLITRHAPTVR